MGPAGRVGKGQCPLSLLLRGDSCSPRLETPGQGTGDRRGSGCPTPQGTIRGPRQPGSRGCGSLPPTLARRLSLAHSLSCSLSSLLSLQACCEACELFTRAQLPPAGEGGRAPSPTSGKLDPAQGGCGRPWATAMRSRRSRRAGRPQGRAQLMSGCTWGVRKGLRPQKHPAPTCPPHPQFISVHWENPSRGREIASVTLEAAALWGPAL